MSNEFPPQETVDIEEIDAVRQVMETGILSHFRGNATERFYGGPKVKELESLFCTHRHPFAISVNSCTSALEVSLLALGIGEGDEVIVSPWSMTCSATAPLLMGALPVFADIDARTFCLSLDSIRLVTTNKTKAIIVVSLFGQQFDPEILEFAHERGIAVIEDAAQSLGTNAQGDLVCYSFTQGKHITAGEGGMIIAKDYDVSYRCQLLRNHAESVVNDLPERHHTGGNASLVGRNLRMTELQAAILVEQLQKLDRFVRLRRTNATRLSDIVNTHRGYLTVPSVVTNHSWYAYAFQLSQGYVDDLAKEFVDRLNTLVPKEEGRPDKSHFGLGYVKPIYRMPIFRGMKEPVCPVVEDAHRRTIVTTLIGLPLSAYHWGVVERAFAQAVRELGARTHG